MKLNIIMALLLTGALTFGCPAGTALAEAGEATTKETVEEVAVPEIEKDAAPGAESLSENISKRKAEMETVAPVKADRIKPGDKSFEDRLIYTTFSQDDPAKMHLEQEIEINGDRYKLAKTGIPTYVKKELISQKTMMYESEMFTGDGSEHEPEETLIGEDGLVYRIVSKTLSEENAQERTEYRETAVEFKGVEAGVQIPVEKNIEFTDQDTKQTVTALVKQKNKEKVREYWSEDFEFPIKITGYDADVFMLNGKEVPKNARLTEYSADFLKLLKLDPGAYRIESIEWSGNEYESEGTLVRNAVAKGSKYLQDIIVTYGGEVTLPAIIGKKWVCEYEEDIPDNLRTVYTMAVDVTYSIDNIAAAGKSIPERIYDAVIGMISAAYQAVVKSFAEHPVISSIPIVALAGLLAYLITKRIRNRCVYSNEVICPHKKRKKGTCQSCVHFHKRQKV